jgi:hypothetical protein
MKYRIMIGFLGESRDQRRNPIELESSMDAAGSPHDPFLKTIGLYCENGIRHALEPWCGGAVGEAQFFIRSFGISNRK